MLQCWPVFLLGNAVDNVVLFVKLSYLSWMVLVNFFEVKLKQTAATEKRPKAAYCTITPASIELAGCIRVTMTDRKNHDCANQLKKKSNNIEAHEEWGDESRGHPAQTDGSFLAGHDQEEDATE
jgi:hypothetical protein